MKGILTVGLFLSLVASYQGPLVEGLGAGDLPYAVLFMMAILLCVRFILNPFVGRAPIQEPSAASSWGRQGVNFKKWDSILTGILSKLWIFIVLSWLVGVLTGLLNGIYVGYVLRNFFGLLVYALFPVILLVSPTSRSLIMAVSGAGLVSILYGIDASFGLVTSPDRWAGVASFSELRSMYNSGLITVFPLFTVALACQFFPAGRLEVNHGKVLNLLFRSRLFLGLLLYVLTVPSFSKGFILATMLLLAGTSLLLLVDLFRTARITASGLLTFAVLLAVLSYVAITYHELIGFSYSSQESSNYIRREQFDYLVDEMRFWGNGLGSPLRSGYTRDDVGGGYGFELSYVSLVHKLGIFSLPLFLAYVLTVMISIRRILYKYCFFESFFALGSMGYLVVGAGNPLLLGPTAVVLHCVAIFILIKSGKS